MICLEKLKKLLLSISYKLQQVCKVIELRLFYRLHIMDSVKTVKYIIEKKCSVSRYGDGEFGILLQDSSPDFQSKTPELSQKLKDTLTNTNPNLLLCVPWCFNRMKYRKPESKKWWISWGLYNNKQKRIVKVVRNLSGKNYIFGDASITRPYISLKSSKRADIIFPLLKQIWANRDVLIVEGEQTRLGVYNDLFQNANSIKRILVPAKNAFSHYNEIVDVIKLHYTPNQLIILAIGPTATVLASDLAKLNMQAVDIGHIDLEYEWYLQKASDRIALNNRYVNEVKNGDDVSSCLDPNYLLQIICKVEK